MVSFDNTEIAFSDRSDAELNRAQFLFKIVGNPTLVKLGQIALNVGLFLRLPIKKIIRSTVFNHFCGGETIEMCEPTMARLHKRGVYSLLDYSAEGKETVAELEQSALEILAANQVGKQDSRVPFSVFKPTAIFPNRLLAKKNANAKFSQKEEIDWSAAKQRINLICASAEKNNIPVLIDAEETWFQDAIDELVEEQMALRNSQKVIVYTTLQLYRKDRLEFLAESLKKAKEKGYHLGVKLVRGAYMEKERLRAEKQGYPTPIHETKADTDRDYDLAVKFCVDNYPNIHLVAGTHNELSAGYLTKLIAERQIELNDQHIFFSQLYGMSDNISFNLAVNGYNVVKYVPYGPILEVMPYLIRRAEENTSVAGQTGRELSLIFKEKARRRAS
ncbi:MAG: proline dehydrogenase family protein [Flavobacteriales bacterium]|jgi:proline dehydrogenase|nr:proline dehydrogenase family protein [Flavobacteriales bacterium]